MRRGIGQSLRIGVANGAVSLLRVSRWPRLASSSSSSSSSDPVTVLAEQSFAPSAEFHGKVAAIANALRALLDEHRDQVAGWPVSIVLADELTRMWRVTPPPGASRLADIEAAAGLRFQTLYGESPAAWQISADWNAGRAFFAAAVPRALLDALTQVAQEHKLAVVGITPHMVSAWNRWRRAMKPGAWFGLAHDGLLTLAAVDGKDIRALRSVPIAHGADQYWLMQTLKREALLLELDEPALLQVCGAVPALWTRPLSSPEHIACTALDHAQQLTVGNLSAVALLARAGSPS